MKKLVFACLCANFLQFVSALCHTAAAQDLFVDFNSTTQDGGPHNNEGYQAYNAGHEVIADFVTQDFPAFGTTIGITPAWPNTTANTVQQMIDRGADFDANWVDTDVDLVTDFLGIDTRTGNGGNGDWDGTTGTPTYMTLTLSGLPASPNEYEWKSYHNDTEHVHGNFAVWLSTDGGSTFNQLPDGYLSDSAPGGNPDSAADGSPGLVVDFAGMEAAGSIYETSFVADGVNDVVFRFALYSGPLGSAVHNQIFGMNGFELIEGVLAGDVNGDLVADIEDYNIIKMNFQMEVDSRGEGDLNGDGTVNHTDFRVWKSARTAVAAVPEPGSWLLALTGVGMLAAFRSFRA